MRKHFKKYLVPHEDNNHQPHVLRNGSTKKIIAIICAVELLILLLILPSRPDSITDRIHDLAAVFPTVLVEKTNKSRLAEAKSELHISDTLTYAAQLKANDMAEKGYFAHTSPDGKTPWYWLQTAGYAYQTAGENLAVNFVDSSDVHNAWLNSPAHRANIVRDGFEEIGIATAEGVYKGKKAIFVAQFFGTPTQRVDTFVQSNTIAVSNVIPAIQATTSSSTTLTEVLGADILVAQESFATTSSASPVVSDVPSVSADSTPLEKATASPRTLLNVILLGLASVITVALVLKIFIKVRIQYPRLILNGVVVLILIYVFTILNTYILSLFTEIV